VYRTVAPTLAATRAGSVRELPIRLESFGSLRFPGAPVLADESLDRFFGDLVAAHGHGYGWTTLVGARARSFTSMAVEMLAALTPPGGPIDQIVLAHATPDIDCWASTGAFLAERIPSRPVVVGVSDQGRSAPFTALRLAGEHRRTAPASGRTLLLVLDQSTVPWAIGRPELVPAYDEAVALVLRPAPAGCGILLSQRTDVSPDEVPGQVGEYLRKVAERLGAAPTLIAGPGLSLPEAVSASADLVCTAVWATAAELADRPGATVLVEYDPDLRYLCLATVDPVAPAC
jgi:hypothetical protein